MNQAYPMDQTGPTDDDADLIDRLTADTAATYALLELTDWTPTERAEIAVHAADILNDYAPGFGPDRPGPRSSR